MSADRRTQKNEDDIGKLRRVAEEAQALEAAYPGYYATDGISEEEAIKLATERLRARAVVGRNRSPEWIGKNLDAITIRVLARECLLHRLIGTLNSRGDIDKATTYARRRGCDEYEAFDAIEDAIFALVQRGHGLQSEDMLLRFFRTIVWEKVHDVIGARERRRRTIKEMPTEEITSKNQVSANPLDTLSAAEARDMLISSLAGSDVSFNAKAALLLKYGASWSSSNVAQVLGVSASQVDLMNFKTRTALRASLASDKVVPSAQSRVFHSNAIAVEAAAEQLVELREKAGLLLYGLFQLPLQEVATLCGVTQPRLLELKAQVTSGFGESAQ